MLSSLFAHRCLNHEVLGTKSIPLGVIRMSIVTEREAVLGILIVVLIFKAGMFRRYSPGGIGALNRQLPRFPAVVMGEDLNDSIRSHQVYFEPIQPIEIVAPTGFDDVE